MMPQSRNLRRRRLRSAVRGDLIVPPTKTVHYTVHAALQSLGCQRGMRYQHHSATTNFLPCHFVASWRLNYTLEPIIHTGTLVTVFTVRVGEHNFNVIIITQLPLLVFGLCLPVQRLSVVIQRFNAILLHNSFEAADHLG